MCNISDVKREEMISKTIFIHETLPLADFKRKGFFYQGIEQ